MQDKPESVLYDFRYEASTSQQCCLQKIVHVMSNFYQVVLLIGYVPDTTIISIMTVL